MSTVSVDSPFNLDRVVTVERISVLTGRIHEAMKDFKSTWAALIYTCGNGPIRRYVLIVSGLLYARVKGQQKIVSSITSSGGSLPRT